MSSQISIKNVVQIGAAGTLGVPVLNALLASKKFEITVLTRESSTASFPTDVRVVKIDFSSQVALVNVLKGNDVVVLTLGGGAEMYEVQNRVADAAIEARVPYIVPSSFGVDTTSEPVKSARIFADKVKSEEYISHLAAEGKIKNLTIFTGTWLDWGLSIDLYADLIDKKAAIFKDHNPPMIATTLPTVADAVVSLLSGTNPDRLANKPIRIHDFVITLPGLIALLEEEIGEKFEVTVEDADEVRNTATKAFFEDGDPSAVLSLLKVTSLGGPKSSAYWEPGKDDSEILALKKKDLREEVRRVLRQMKVIT